MIFILHKVSITNYTGHTHCLVVISKGVVFIGFFNLIKYYSAPTYLVKKILLEKLITLSDKYLVLSEIIEIASPRLLWAPLQNCTC